jgi:hypothetical protein
MQSEIDDIRTACNVAEILHDSEQGMTTLDFRQFIRCVRNNLDLIEAQQAHNLPSDPLRSGGPRIPGAAEPGQPGPGTVNLPILTLAMIAQAAARERLAQGKPALRSIEGGRNG